MYRLIFAALFVLAAIVALPARPAHALDQWDGFAVELSGFTPDQSQTIRNGFDLFGAMASPALRRPAMLRLTAVPGQTSITYAAYVNAQLVDVWITFGTDRLGVGQVIHELIHVLQVENPAWGERERAYAAAHPYPGDAIGQWIGTAATSPESEYVPRIIECLFMGGAYAAYAGRQPEAVRYALWALASP